MVSTVLRSRITLDNTGNVLELPVLITSDGLLESYLNYLIAYRNRSESWRERSVFAIRLLLNYMDANKDVFDQPQKMFTEFSNCLFTGTVSTNGDDPSGLYWHPRRHEDAHFLISLITHFTDYLALINDSSGLQLNPFRKADKYEERLNWAAYCQKRDRAFLSHLWSTADAQEQKLRTRYVSTPADAKVEAFDTVKAFPENHIDDLFNHGFVLPGQGHETALYKRLNLRDVLITMLLHYGGLRVSEAFHIFSQDITVVEGDNIGYVVKVYHPIFGRAPTKKNQTRKEYLATEYQLKPRKEYAKKNRIYAGWKSPLLTNQNGKFFTVYFFPRIAGDYFFELWKLYIKHQRIKPQKGEEHPYAFTSRSGSPHTIRSYLSSHKRAVERIGLVYAKEECTTSHAHRHAYGQRLATSKVRTLIIRTAMHHQSLEAQQTYTRPSAENMRKELNQAENQLTTVMQQQGLFIKHKRD